MDVLKTEKERTMLRYRRLRRAAALSRCLLESLAALALLSWFSDRLPAALALCAGLRRRLLAVIVHPFSAFVLCNAIVATLLAKSGDAHPGEDSPPSRCAAARPTTAATLSPAARAFDVCDHLGYHVLSPSPAPPPHLQRIKDEEEGALYEYKAACAENTTAAASHPKERRPQPEWGLCLRSEDLAEAVSSKGTEQKLLCRSETELGARQKVVAMWAGEEEDDDDDKGEEGSGRVVVVVDDGVEFRRKIEAFITKQLRFIEREEEELLFAEVSK